MAVIVIDQDSLAFLLGMLLEGTVVVMPAEPISVSEQEIDFYGCECDACYEENMRDNSLDVSDLGINDLDGELADGWPTLDDVIDDDDEIPF